jgi:hypothetical protein
MQRLNARRGCGLRAKTVKRIVFRSDRTVKVALAKRANPSKGGDAKLPV